MLKKHIRAFFLRTYVLPFTAMFATWCIYSGIAGLLHFGVVSTTVNELLDKMAVVFNWAFTFAGLAMLFGLGLGKRNIEALGLILVSTAVLIRAIAVGYFLGFAPAIINNYFFTLIFIVACGLRLHALSKFTKIVAIKREQSSV